MASQAAAGDAGALAAMPGLLRADAPGEITGAPQDWPRWAMQLPHVLAAAGHLGTVPTRSGSRPDTAARQPGRHRDAADQPRWPHPEPAPDHCQRLGHPGPALHVGWAGQAQPVHHRWPPEWASGTFT